MAFESVVGAGSASSWTWTGELLKSLVASLRTTLLGSTAGFSLPLQRARVFGPHTPVPIDMLGSTLPETTCPPENARVVQQSTEIAPVAVWGYAASPMLVALLPPVLAIRPPLIRVPIPRPGT